MKTMILLISFFCQFSLAADWVQLGSKEKDPSLYNKTIFFLQPRLATTDSSNLSAGPFQGEKGIFNLFPPDFDRDENFQLVRAIAITRGVIPGTDGKINYLGAIDAGQNILTGSERSTKHPTPVQLLDLSLTLGYIPHVDVRLGQFVTPGSNEMMQPAKVWDFVTPTWFSIFALLDWQLETAGDGSSDNRPLFPNNGFRDIGAMFFSSFERSRGVHSFAAMLGNGNGISRWEDDGLLDFYWRYRFATNEKMKYQFEFVHWGVHGNRSIYNGVSREIYKRQRFGLDLNSKFSKFRFSLGGGYADGMIFHGSFGAGQPGITNQGGQVASFLLLPSESAHAYYASVAYDFRKKISFAARFDQTDYGLREANNRRRFKNLAIAAQYRFNKNSPTRLMVEYDHREASAPGLVSEHPVNQFLQSMGDRIAMHLLLFF